MTLLEQCQKWHESDEYTKIVDALEDIPEDQRTPEMDLELARAYNNLADPREPEGRRMLWQAIDLMKPHGEPFSDDYSWNFRMAYAYYYLDQEGPALRHFQRSLELHPGDDPKRNTEAEIREFIEDCRSRLSLPRFEKNFRERTQEAWAAFVERESKLRRLMDQEDRDAVAEELIAKCDEILHLAFGNAAFEMGFNGEKYELILTPEGDKAKLFALVYFQSHAPASILEHWNILVGRQPTQNCGLRSKGWEVSGEDVQVWTEKLDDQSVGLTLYCEKLLPLLGEQENRAWWMLSTLTDQILGEIPNMMYIDTFDVADAPKDEPSIPLTELPKALENMGLSLSLDPRQYLDNSYTGYRMEPEEDPQADWRLDVMAGSTRCVPLINEYLNAESDRMDDLHRDGAVPGFLCYPLDGFTGDERAKNILDFRDALEAAILENAGEDAVTSLGGATGLYCGYWDFIAWDLRTVLDAAAAFFQESPLQWANFHSFRRDVGTVRLLDREDGEPDEQEPTEETMGNERRPAGPTEFDETIKPFFWVEHKDSASLCLNAGAYLQEVFDTRADEGFEGGGYDWESLARVFLEEKCPDLLEKVAFDCEAGMFCAYSQDTGALQEFARRFKAACEDQALILDLFSRAEVD